MDPDRWWLHGACRGADPDGWYPGRTDDPSAQLAVCDRCPVWAPCLVQGLGERFGVWGRLRVSDRRLLRRMMRRNPDASVLRLADLIARNRDPGDVDDEDPDVEIVDVFGEQLHMFDIDDGDDDGRTVDRVAAVRAPSREQARRQLADRGVQLRLV